MINNISWVTYWTAIGIILFIYYTSICLRYYLFEVKQILSGKLKLTFKKRLNSYPIEAPSQQDFFPVINQFQQQIKTILSDAAEKNLIKQEIIYSLQLLFKKYAIVKDTSFQSSINDYILNEYSNYCSIHLNEEDVMSLWVN